MRLRGILVILTALQVTGCMGVSLGTPARHDPLALSVSFLSPPETLFGEGARVRVEVVLAEPLPAEMAAGLELPAGVSLVSGVTELADWTPASGGTSRFEAILRASSAGAYDLRAWAQAYGVDGKAAATAEANVAKLVQVSGDAGHAEVRESAAPRPAISLGLNPLRSDLQRWRATVTSEAATEARLDIVLPSSPGGLRLTQAEATSRFLVRPGTPAQVDFGIAYDGAPDGDYEIHAYVRSHPRSSGDADFVIARVHIEGGRAQVPP